MSKTNTKQINTHKLNALLICMFPYSVVRRIFGVGLSGWSTFSSCWPLIKQKKAQEDEASQTSNVEGNVNLDGNVLHLCLFQVFI